MKIYTFSDLVNDIKHNEISLLVGAGLSVSGGIPLAGEIAENIAKELCLPDSSDYYKIIANLSANKRREIFLNYDLRSEINSGSLLAATLLGSGKVQSILTTNFDSLIQRAAALSLTHLRTYDATFSAIRSDLFTPHFPSLVYLHGQAHGFWQLNTFDEHKEYKKNIEFFLEHSLKKCSGQVISDSLLGFLDVDSRSKALGDMLPSFECSLCSL